MKTIWFHMQGYRDLPDDFRDRYESIWVTPPNDELCHSPEVAKYLHWNLTELEMADELGSDGLAKRTSSKWVWLSGSRPT